MRKGKEPPIGLQTHIVNQFGMVGIVSPDNLGRHHLTANLNPA
jgi:hypothetical protein